MIILLSLLLISILIMVHELGHYGAAKLCGVQVYEFSIGFGPALVPVKTKQSMLVSLRLIPRGGYVRLAGLDTANLEQEKSGGRRFQEAPLGSRLFILGAGSLANLLVSFGVLFAVYGFGGLHSTVTTVIESVAKGSPAQQVQLHSGDKIIAIDQQTVSGGAALVAAIHASKGRPLHIKILRKNSLLDVAVVPTQPSDDLAWQIGVKLRSSQSERFQWSGALFRAINDTVQGVVLTLVGIGQLLTGRIGLSAMSGPIGIVSVTGEMVNYGVLFLGRFVAFLGINLAVLNCLPLPALDGGRFLLEGLRVILPFRIKESFVARIHLAGALALIILMLVVTWFDITKLSVR